MPKLNFAGVGDQPDYSPIPAGKYQLRLTDFKDGEVQNGDNKGASRTSLTFEVVEHEKYNGRKVFDNVTIVKNSLPRIKGMLRAFGAPVDDSEGAEDVEWDWDDLLGNDVMARVRIEPERKDEVNGRTYRAKNGIEKFLIPGTDDDD